MASGASNKPKNVFIGQKPDSGASDKIFCPKSEFFFEKSKNRKKSKNLKKIEKIRFSKKITSWAKLFVRRHRIEFLSYENVFGLGRRAWSQFQRLKTKYFFSDFFFFCARILLEKIPGNVFWYGFHKKKIEKWDFPVKNMHFFFKRKL